MVGICAPFFFFLRLILLSTRRALCQSAPLSCAPPTPSPGFLPVFAGPWCRIMPACIMDLLTNYIE